LKTIENETFLVKVFYVFDFSSQPPPWYCHIDQREKSAINYMQLFTYWIFPGLAACRFSFKCRARPRLYNACR